MMPLAQLLEAHLLKVHDRVAKFDKPGVKIMFQVTQIVRFLLEGGLRFRNLVFCEHELI